MRSRRFSLTPVKLKVGVMTGGVKEDKPQLELKIGELIRGHNYQEVDGVYHGYRSMEGYEVYDGTPLASSVDIGIMEDRGVDKFTTLLIEPTSTTITDLSRNSYPISPTNLIVSSSEAYTSLFSYSIFFDPELYLPLNENTILNEDTILYKPEGHISFNHKNFSSNSFCIEALILPTDTSYIYDGGIDFKFYIDHLTGHPVVNINNLEYEYEFATVVPLDTYSFVSLRRIGDTLHFSINGVEEVTTLELANGYEIPFTESTASVRIPLGFLSQYRISQVTYRRFLNNYQILPLAFSDPSYLFTDSRDIEREATRDGIEAVGGVLGEGPVRGCFKFEDVVYAVRDKSLAGGVWKSTTLGWEELTSTLPKGGSYKFISGRFDLLPELQRKDVVFFTTGVGPACYIDGSDEVQSITHVDLPEAPAYPTSLVEFKNRLWLGYPDGRLVFSNVGNPTDFNSTTFSGTIYIEDEIVDLQVSVGDTLLVLCKNSIYMVKALSSGDAGTQVIADYLFSVSNITNNIGAVENTARRIFDDIVYVDERGLTAISATDQYGDFETKSYSKAIQKTLSSRLNNIVGVIVKKDYNQYRLLFSDGFGIIFTFETRVVNYRQTKVVKGITTFRYLTSISCCNDGVFGSDDGFVYVIDSGTSYNGQEIDTYLHTSFHHYDSPSYIKDFKQMFFEGSIPYGLDIFVKASFDYKDYSYTPSTEEQKLLISGGVGGRYGEGVYGVIRYGGSENQTSIHYLSGYGTNMGVSLITSNKYLLPHIISSMIVQYSINGRR